MLFTSCEYHDYQTIFTFFYYSRDVGRRYLRCLRLIIVMWLFNVGTKDAKLRLPLRVLILFNYFYQGEREFGEYFCRERELKNSIDAPIHLHNSLSANWKTLLIYQTTKCTRVQWTTLIRCTNRWVRCIVERWRCQLSR